MDELVRMIKEHISMAKVLDAKVNRPTLLLNPKDLVKLCTVLLPTLKKYGVKYGLEIHAPMPPRETLKVVETVKDPHVGVVPDFSAWQTKGLPAFAGMGTWEDYRALMPYTVHVHAKGHVFDEKGEEPNAPYDKLITILKESGYCGYISAEYEGWWFRDTDSKKIVETHVNLIKRYL
jgi:sugar phosphate isomerase/epimerase